MGSKRTANGEAIGHRTGALRWAGAAALVTAAVVPLTGVAAADGPDDGLPVFSEAHFSHPTTIDNPFLPLLPGRQLVFVGTANRGQGQGTHRIVFTVTDMVKEVDGIETVVVWDRDFQDGALAEAELSLWAQDDAGNVWNLGEYPEEWEDGALAGAPSTWLTGRQQAIAGIHMLADPVPGGPAYVQGRAPRIDFFDKAKVVKKDQRTCAPTGCYKGVLVTNEWAPLDQPQDGHQLKFSAPGVGIVRIEPLGGVEQETVVLTKDDTLTDAERAEARAKVVTLDTRAYTLAKDIWQGTPPAHPAA
jgi:hypothetical protein